MKALQGEAKRKYFEHAGALLTADGTDDDLLIKLEGAPAGYKVVIPQLTSFCYFLRAPSLLIIQTHWSCVAVTLVAVTHTHTRQSAPRARPPPRLARLARKNASAQRS